MNDRPVPPRPEPESAPRPDPDAAPAPDADAVLAPAAMLALLERQQQEMQRRLASFVPWILLAWGVAWLVGFGALWLVDGAAPALAIPPGVAGTVFGVLMGVALVVSAVLGARSGRGIRSTPQSRFTGAVFGISASGWFVALYVFAFALVENGMDPALAGVYFPTGSALVVGFMYVIAGGIWRVVPAIAMGAWIVVVGLVAPFFGVPTHYLVFAIAGGGVFLLGALVLAIRFRARGGR